MSARDDLLVLLDQGEALIEEQLATFKTIGQVIKQYDDGLSSLVYEAFNHRMDAVDMRRNMKELMRELAPAMIVEGFREGGLNEEDTDDDDQAWAKEHATDWLADQLQYVNGFAADAYAAGKDKDKRADILSRIEMWVDALRALGETARAYVMSDTKGQWKLGDRQTHTPDCVRLAQMGPKRLSYFIDRGYIPGQMHLGCGCRIANPKTDETLMGE